MITLHASAAYGHGGKQFVARIIGRDAKYTFDRQFIGTRCGKRDEGTEADIDTPGLYEIRNIDRKGNKLNSYYIVLGTEESLKKYDVDKSDAMKIAKRLDDREDIAAVVAVTDGKIVVLNAAAIKQHKTAATVGSATEHCWELLQKLPLKDARKVLAALRQRLIPKTKKPVPEEVPRAT